MSDPAPPAYVAHPDGRTEPFDADRISASLFAAGEAVGRPDAFLARELTDGVVHFLGLEAAAPTVAAGEIAEVVAKVVRELGHAALAAAYEQRARRTGIREPQGVFSRDLAAAAGAGLLTLGDADPAAGLESCVLDAAAPLSSGLEAALARAEAFGCRQVALDGLEHLAASTRQSPSDLARAVAGWPGEGGREVVVNLATAGPPPWAAALVEGPLFAPPPPADVARREDLAGELLDELLALGRTGVRIDWHVNEGSFGPGGREGLLRAAGRALAGANVCFVFDRPRRPVALAEGLDRRRPAVLLRVGLHLPALANLPGMLADQGRFRQRLGSLVRLALSAAVQKRRHLRGAGAPLTQGFLLDRARLVAAPVGLDAVVRLYTGWGLCNYGESLELGRQVVRRLGEVLRQDGRAAQMDACLDGPAGFTLGGPAGPENACGLTPWDEGAAAARQLGAADALHRIAEHGTLALRLPGGDATTPEDLTVLLEDALRRTAVVRLRLVRRPAAPAERP
jgi:hypothetical protein